MAENVLSKGMLARMAAKEEIQSPILQCVQIKALTNQGGGANERYRVIMSDSVHFIQGMLATQLNHLIQEDVLKRGSICRIDQYSTNIVKERLILIVVGCTILAEHGEPEKIGTPVAILPPPTENQGNADAQPGNIAGNNFYGQKAQAQPQQQQHSLPSRTNGTANSGRYGTIQPIEALSPYGHKWTIKARCTQKSEIKTWKNQKGEGKLFSVNLLDESGEIRATGFNDAVDMWYELFQEGQVYYVSSPAKLNLAKKQFSNLNHEYEIMFEHNTVVEKAEDMDGVPQVHYNFTTIENIQNVDKDAIVDVIGVLRSVGDTDEITSKTSGKPFSKRELTLADNSGYDIRLTIWGKTAQNFDVATESVVAFKGVKVSDFGGRSLSLLSSGTMAVDPDIDDAHKLKGWYDGSGRDETFANHQSVMGGLGATSGGRKDDFKTIAQVTEEGLGMNEEKPDYFSLKATVMYIKADGTWSYPACRSENCNKKVVEHEEGKFRCEKCDKNWDAPEHRYIMSINVSDHTGSMWLSCFNDTGVQVMGMTANELKALEFDGHDNKVKETFSDATCKTVIFRVRAKMEMFSDQQRVRFQVQSSQPVNYTQEATKLAALIKQYSLEEESSLFVS